MAKSKTATFRSELLAGHKECAVEVPFDPAVRWGIPAAPLRRGRRGHHAAGSLEGVSFVSAIVPRSRRFWLLVADDLMEAAAVEVGDQVAVELWPLPGSKPLAPRARSKKQAVKRRRA